jgi:hypothetical protein
MMAPILPRPARPGWLRICPACRRWLALRFRAERTDPLCDRIRVYRCSACGKETAFAARHPRGALGVRTSAVAF